MTCSNLDNESLQFLTNTNFVDMVGVIGGPSLPVPLAGHCLIKISDERVLFTGGITSIDDER